MATVRCYRIYMDDVPIADKLTLANALIFIEGLCNKYNQDSFSITLVQKQAIIEKEKTNE